MFEISVPISLDWLAGIAIDNLANILAAACGTTPRYSTGLINTQSGSITIMKISLPDDAYDYLVQLAQSKAINAIASRAYNMVDGFLARQIGSSTVQQVINTYINAGNRQNLEQSINSVNVSVASNGIVIKWGSRGRWISSRITPYPLRSVEILEGARVWCPRQLVVHGTGRRKRVSSGFTVAIEIDTYVYSMIALSLLASTMTVRTWRRGRGLELLRAVLYRLAGFDSIKLLKLLAKGEWKLFSTLIGSESELRTVLRLDRERGLQVPEILVMHFLIASIARHAEIYNARLDIVSYRHIPRQRGDIELALSIHFAEYRKLMALLARETWLAEWYRKVLAKVAEKLYSDREEEVRAASLGIELVYLIDKIVRDIATPNDIYAVSRSLATYRMSKYYRVFGDDFDIFEVIAREFIS